jgi:hypothetical protein
LQEVERVGALEIKRPYLTALKVYHVRATTKGKTDILA